MKKFRLFTLGLFLCAFLTPKMSIAQATSQKVELPWEIFIPCANNGLGEWASGTITLHFVVNKVKWYHHQPTGSTLTGEVTGTVYHATGITEELTIDAAIQMTTFVGLYHFNGGGIQFMERAVYRVKTIDGEPVVIVEHEETYCR